MATGYYITTYTKSNPKYYWALSSFAIIAYSLIEGLRYNRGVDYMHYKKLFEHSLNLNAYWEEDTVEPLFQFINKSLNTIGFSYPVAFIIYSFILIYGLFYWTKQYRNFAFLTIPIFFLFTISQSENLIRQFIAFSFVLISLTFFLKHKWFKFGIIFLASTLIHSSVIVYLPFIFLFRFIDGAFANIYVILTLYLLSWLWKPEYWGEYNEYFKYLQITAGTYDRYIDDSDKWLSGAELMQANSLLVYIRLFFVNLILIVMGYKILKSYKQYNISFYYNLFLVGAILQHITDQIELLYRISLSFYLFGFIVLAFIIYDVFIKKYSSNRWIEKSVVALVAVNVLYDYLIGSLLSLRPEHALFVWDIQ
ncbi:hypothetical protein GCM10028810_08060 [Spirosoma litoris]